MPIFPAPHVTEDMASSQTGVLKKKLQELKDESTTLKSTIHRLNAELSRYQAQFRPLTDKEVRFDNVFDFLYGILGTENC